MATLIACLFFVGGLVVAMFWKDALCQYDVDELGR